jgi:hypothetical protein
MSENTKKTCRSSLPREHESRDHRRLPAGNHGRRQASTTPAEETENDGRIEQAVSGLLGRSLARDERGRFTFGQVKNAARSRQLYEALAPLKAETIAAVRVQLAADTDDAPVTLLNAIDAYADAHLLRKAMFAQLAQRGGPITNKGRVRGLLSAWCQFLDRELRLVQLLGLERRSRPVAMSTREWLLNDDHDANADIPSRTTADEAINTNEE